MTDLEVITGTLFSLMWWLLPLLLIAALFRSSWFINLTGKSFLKFSLCLFLKRKDYHLIEHVKLPTEEGDLQLDYLIVSRFGLFAVEITSMQGWIYGNDHYPLWQQRLGDKKLKFENPLIQSHEQSLQLQSLLGVDSAALFPVVLFTGDSRFITEMPDNVIQADDFIPYIRSHQTVVFSDLEVKNLIEQIETDQLTPSFNSLCQHVRNKHETVEARQIKRA